MHTELPASTRLSWPRWADFLRQRRLEWLACWAIEAFGPLMPLGAQALLAGSPFLRAVISGKLADSLVELLDDPAEALAFARFLREDTVP
jgi:hypothetical protein